MAIVKQTAVPLRMTSHQSFVKIAMITSIKLVQPVFNVFTSVAMNNVQQHFHSMLVRGIYQKLKLFWRSVAGGRSKKTSHLVAETSIVRVLLNRHELNGIIPIFSNMWYYMLGEMLVCRYFLFFTRDSHMSFIDFESRL